VKRLDVIESLERRTYFALSFATAAYFPTGTNPSDLVAVDLTGNGITDVVTSDYSSASIAVLRGNGNGTFQPPVFYGVGINPEALASGDFTGSGVPDIVTTNSVSNSVSVLIGNGDGTFRPAVNYAVGVRPEAVAVGDLTGNGILDIVTANEGSSDVSVLMGNGDGTFQPAVQYNCGGQPDGVAVGDLTGGGLLDIVTINTLNSNLHILENSGSGTFPKLETYSVGAVPRSVTIADVNADGIPDIITTNLHSTNVSVLLGNGNGTFQTQQNYPTGGFPFSVAVGDINGDERPDIVMANDYDNNVGVLLHNANGSFSSLKGYKTGNGGLSPVAVALADVNGDGKLDLITANFNSDSISVLINKTVFTPLIPTTAVLSVGQNPVEDKNRLVLSVQITTSSPGKYHPTGLVPFFDGNAAIGLGKVSAVTGIAPISISSLGLGLHNLSALYEGDNLYAGERSNHIVETVVTPAVVSPLLSPTVSAVRLPASYVAGDRGTISVSINDTGDGPAKGKVAVQLYASLNSSFGSTAFPIAVDGNSLVNVNLAGGRSQIANLSFTVPTGLDAANYTFFAALAPSTGFTTAEVSTVPAVGTTSAQSVLEFGSVGKHVGYRLTRTLSTGTVVTLSLSGRGTGVLSENSDGSIGLVLSNTTGGSNLGITTTNGAAVTLDSLTATGLVGNILAPTTTADGTIAIGGVRTFTLAGATNSNITISGGNINTLLLGTLAGTSLYSAAPIRTLNVNSYTDTTSDAITTAWIGTLKSAGDFGASMYLNGYEGGRRLSLASATIGGSLNNSVWSVQGNIGTVQTTNVATGWSGSIHGTIASFIDTGDFAGVLGALGIGTVQISGNLTDADILAGAEFGTVARLGYPGNVFGSGVLSSLIVDGSVSGSIVAAGLSPVDDNPAAAGGTLLKRSAIRALAVSGSVDSSSRFLSISVPATVRIDGLETATAGDPNFTI
jgi:hypothetical protein